MLALLRVLLPLSPATSLHGMPKAADGLLYEIHGARPLRHKQNPFVQPTPTKLRPEGLQAASKSVDLLPYNNYVFVPAVDGFTSMKETVG